MPIGNQSSNDRSGRYKQIGDTLTPTIKKDSIPVDIDPITKKLWWIASMYLRTGMGIPTGSKSSNYGKLYKTVEEVFIILYTGHSFGMNEQQSLSNIRVQGGKMSIWGDAVPALAYRTGEVEDFEEHFEGNFPEEKFKAVCTIKRKGVTSEKVSTFSIGDAKRAGLWSPTVKADEEKGFDKTTHTPGKNFWHKYPRRMLQMRARAFALRDAFPDALGGFYITEELVGDVEDHPVKVNSVKTKQPALTIEPTSAENKRNFMAMLSKVDGIETLNEAWKKTKGTSLEKDTSTLKEIYEEALGHGFFKDGAKPKKNEFRDWVTFQSTLIKDFLKDYSQDTVAKREDCSCEEE